MRLILRSKVNRCIYIEQLINTVQQLIFYYDLNEMLKMLEAF